MSRESSGEKRSRFPLSIFWIVLSVLLITAGVHVAILLGMEIAGWDPIVQTHIMVMYWISVSVLLTLLIRSRMKVAYDTPLQEISEATKKVAQSQRRPKKWRKAISRCESPLSMRREKKIIWTP